MIIHSGAGQKVLHMYGVSFNLWHQSCVYARLVNANVKRNIILVISTYA